VSLSPSRPFILRPVATSLLMFAILLAGWVAFLQLPISALPQVDYPIIQVLTFYPGAGPEGGARQDKAALLVSSATEDYDGRAGSIVWSSKCRW